MAQKVQPHILERYELIKKIGNGAYGHVWKAVDRKSKKIVALKKIFDAFQHSTDAQRTYREIMFLQEFSHDNIIKLLDVIPSQNDQDIYLIFEHMDIDLYHLVKQDILKKHQQQFIIYQIAKALKYLHSAELLHRDIKPSNILIDVECRVKLCDFGLVRSLDRNEEEDAIVMTEYVATRWYRAPEILMRSQCYTKGVDIWSFGCLIAEMVKGRPLFPGVSTIDQLERVVAWTGIPKKSDIEALGSDAGLSMLENLNGLKLKGKQESLHSDDKMLLDLVNRMLQFNPRKRISIEEVLKHPYLEDFHDFKNEPSCQNIIRVPISDNKRLSVKDYKMLIYKEINRRTINDRTRSKDPRTCEIECSIPISLKKPERKTSLRGSSKQSDDDRGKSIGLKVMNSTKTRLKSSYASPSKLTVYNNPSESLKYQALKTKLLTEAKECHYSSISKGKTKSAYTSKKHSLKTQGNIFDSIPLSGEDEKKRSQSIHSSTKKTTQHILQKFGKAGSKLF